MLKNLNKLFLLLTIIVLSFNTLIVSAGNFGLSPDQAKPGDANDNFSATVKIYQDEDGIATVETGKTTKSSLGGWWTKLLKPYKVATLAVVGIATLTMILVFIKLCLRLASCESHPMLREQTIRGMLMSGIACALLGSLTIYLAIISNIFR